MATVPMPRPTLDRAIWGTCSPCPMPTLDPYNYPIVAATPHDWYNPAVFVSGCENPANAGSSGTGGGSFLYDPKEDAWMDIPHFLGMDPDYSVAGTYSHGAATFHPTGPSGTAVSGSASGIVVDKYLPGDVAVGATIRITGGTGAGQSRTITAVSDTETYTDYLAPVYKDMTTASSASASSLVANKPALCVDGDMLVAVVFINGTILPNSVPAGWTLQDGPRGGAATGGAIYTKVASGEPASWTWGWALSGQVHVYTFCYSGTDAIDTATGGGTGAGGDGTSVPSMTVARNNSAVVVGAYNGWSGLALPNPLPVPMNFAPTPPSNRTAPSLGNLNAGTSQPIAFGGNSDGRTGTSAVVLRPSVQGTLTRTRRQANAPYVVNRTSGEANSTLTLNVPPGTLDGDLMVTTLATAGNYPNGWAIAGWSSLGIVVTPWSTIQVLSRTASSEPASYTFTHVSSLWGRCITFRNATEGGVFVTGQGVSTTLTSQVPVTTPGARILHHGFSGATYTSPSTPFSAIDQSGPWTALTDGRLYGGLSEPLIPSYGNNPVSLSYTCGANGDGIVYTVVLPTQSPSGTTVLTVDSPWSVQPDATSTYAIDSGSFWCWRGNASDSTWRWAKYDIATGQWTKKTATDAVSAPTYVNSTTATGNTGSTLAINVPAGVSNGHLLLLAAWADQNGVSTPAGWNLLTSSGVGGGGSVSSFYLFWRVASSEPASYTITRGLALTDLQLTMLAYSGAGTPVVSNVPFGSGLNPAQTLTTTSFPVTAVPGLMVGFGGYADVGYPAFNSKWTLALPYSSATTTRVDTSQMTVSEQSVSFASTTTATMTATATRYPDQTPQYGLGAAALVHIPASSQGMSNYGKADPSRQGGIHAATDSSDTIWLGGDAQTSLRKYVISTDTWSVLTAHEPYTRPMRNVGGGMAYQTVSGDPYIFYWTPNESENAYDNTARFYAYDLTSNLWYDLLVSPGSPVSAMPSKYKRILSYNGRILWLSDRSEVVVQDPTKIDALTPDNYLALVRNSPSRSGGTPFMVTDSITGSKFLYHIEHTNVQGIQPLRCNVTGRDWV